MSNLFYSYLSDKIINYFRNNSLRPGDKYYVQFENDNQVELLYRELQNNLIARAFTYNDLERGEEYKTYELGFNNVQLLVASTCDGSHQDFLATLRNYVGVEEGYENKAIFFIHSSTLDSLLGGAGSFHKEGMPLNIYSIEGDINRKLQDSDFSEVDKAIFKMYLKNKKNELVGSSPSIFEYEDILSILETSQIHLKSYNKFGMFPDDKLSHYSGKKLEQRIEDNSNNYAKVSEIHNYGISDLQLEKYYDEKGVNRLKKDDWFDTHYVDIEKFIADKKNKTIIEYIPCVHISFLWDREEGSSKSKSRIRNILLFNDSGETEMTMELAFTEYTKLQNISYDKNAMVCDVSGKKLLITLQNIKRNATFYSLKYKTDDASFDFRIAVVNIERKYFESIRTNYSIVIRNKADECSILINSDEAEIIINEFAAEEQKVNIKSVNQLVYADQDKMILSIDELYPFSDDIDMIKFRLCINNCVIPMLKIGAAEKPKVIEGLKLWKLKRDYKTNFEYVGENKLQHGTKSYFTRDEFRRNLELEREFIKYGEFGLFENHSGLIPMDLKIDEKIKIAFSRLINYFRNKNCLPSLTYIDDVLESLYRDYLSNILNVLDTIQDGGYLALEQKDIFYIGMIKRNTDDQEIMLTPLHALNIAYQLQIKEINTTCIDDVETDLIRKFQHVYLLPFININPYSKEPSVYIPIEQSHSPEWKVYVEERLPRYKGSKEYVSKLVVEKIEEFTDHFSYLFDMGNKAPIRINLVNTGDSLEILEGVFKYYVKRLRGSKNKKITPIFINVYTKSSSSNAFEEFSLIDDVNVIKEMFDLDLNVDDMNEDEVIDLYRENVKFYSKDVLDKLEYAHITFVEMFDDSQVISTSMEDIPSGIVMNGITTGVPSVLLADTYRTGFGIKYFKTNSELVNIAIKLNSINAAINGSQYREKTCSALTIPKTNQSILDKIYDSSNWVTFINPKVDLSYFKNDPSSRDLLIIHYSDQYNTTSSGYDAITVTRKSRQYQNVIENYLSKHDIQDADKKSPDIINMFNAINGDWLLRLLSSKSYFPKEKLSILSAIKYAVRRFESQDIIWIPVSLEEILRISGGVGLRQKDSLFSAKNLGFENGGATSDDILLVGIRASEHVQVTFYPIEVKIGKNDPGYIEKGIRQVLNTKDIFMKTIGLGKANDENIKVRLYRNFFMQLAVTNAEKLLLYSVGDGTQGWEIVTDSELRQKLLNEDYEIVDSLIPQMGKAGLISFKKDSLGNKEFFHNDVFIIEKTEKDGINILTKKISEIEISEYELIDEINTLNQASVFEAEENMDQNQIHSETENSYNLHNEESIFDDLNKEIAVTSSETENSSVSDIEVERNMEIVFGEKQDINKPLIWYPNDSSKVLHTNTGIIGTMGTGKTQFTKSLITQIHREEKYNLNKKPIGILVFDYKGDYNKTKPDFLEATGAKVYCLEDLPFNPLSLAVTENSKPRLPLHTANGLKETIKTAFGLGIKQETLLRDIIMDAYAQYGIIVNDSSTWSKQAPTLQDVYNVYVQRDDLKEDSLYAAFSNLIDFEIFEPDGGKTKSLFELIEGVTVIDLSGYDVGIQNLVVAITLDLFYTQMQAYGHSNISGNIRQLNKMILVDEADNFLSQDFSSLKKILKEGREFGVGTILSTQLLSHFSTGDNEYENYILTWVIHNVSDLSMKDIKYIFNTQSKSEEEYLFNQIKNLEKHHSVVKMGDSRNAITIKDKAFWELDK